MINLNLLTLILFFLMVQCSQGSGDQNHRTIRVTDRVKTNEPIIVKNSPTDKKNHENNDQNSSNDGSDGSSVSTGTYGGRTVQSGELSKIIGGYYAMKDGFYYNASGQKIDQLSKYFDDQGNLKGVQEKSYDAISNYFDKDANYFDKNGIYLGNIKIFFQTDFSDFASDKLYFDQGLNAILRYTDFCSGDPSCTSEKQTQDTNLPDTVPGDDEDIMGGDPFDFEAYQKEQFEIYSATPDGKALAAARETASDFDVGQLAEVLPKELVDLLGSGSLDSAIASKYKDAKPAEVYLKNKANGHYLALCMNCPGGGSYNEFGTYVHVPDAKNHDYATWILSTSKDARIYIQNKQTGTYLSICSRCIPYNWRWKPTDKPVKYYYDAVYTHVTKDGLGPWAEWTIVDQSDETDAIMGLQNYHTKKFLSLCPGCDGYGYYRGASAFAQHPDMKSRESHWLIEVKKDDEE